MTEIAVILALLALTRIAYQVGRIADAQQRAVKIAEQEAGILEQQRQDADRARCPDYPPEVQ